MSDQHSSVQKEFSQTLTNDPYMQKQSATSLSRNKANAPVNDLSSVCGTINSPT